MEAPEQHYRAAGICSRPHLLLTVFGTSLSTERRVSHPRRQDHLRRRAEELRLRESKSKLPASRKPRAQIGIDWTANATRLHAPKLGSRRALQQRQIG